MLISHIHVDYSEGRSLSTSLKVLHVASGDLWAGAEVQLYTLCRQQQADQGIELYVVLMNEGELARRLREMGAAVKVFDESELSFSKILARFLRYCKDVRPSIIHSHRRKENILAGVCSVLLRIPSIRTVHGASEFDFSPLSAKGLIKRLDDLVGRYFQKRVVAVSDDLKQKLCSDFPESHLSVVRNGVDLEGIEAVEKVQWASVQTRIGIVGRLTPVKRIDVFIDMAAEYCRKYPDSFCHFYVIGDGPLFTESKQRAESLGLSQRLHFLGHVSPAIPSIKALDYLVMCSDHEGTPMTLLEAMTARVPIIAHDVGGLNELLDRGRCGVLVKNNSAQEFEKALSALIHSEQRSSEFIENAYSRVKQYYSDEACAKAYRDLYLTLII